MNWAQRLLLEDHTKQAINYCPPVTLIQRCVPKDCQIART